MHTAGNCLEYSQWASWGSLSVDPLSTTPESIGNVYHAFCCIALLSFGKPGLYKHSIILLHVTFSISMCCKQNTVHFCCVFFVSCRASCTHYPRTTPHWNHTDYFLKRECDSLLYHLLLCSSCVNAQLFTMSRPSSPDIIPSAYVKMASELLGAPVWLIYLCCHEHLNSSKAWTILTWIRRAWKFSRVLTGKQSNSNYTRNTVIWY